MSPRDIHAIIKEEEARRQKYKQQELSSKAYELFNEKKSTVEVAISLNLTEPRVSKMYREYCKLKRQDILNLIDKETNGKLGIFLKLYKQLIKEKGMSVDQVVNLLTLLFINFLTWKISIDRPEMRLRRCNSQYNDWQMI